MNRKKAERWLSRYLDGQLDPKRAGRLEQRLAEDPALRARAEAWRSYGDRLRDRGDHAPDPDAAWAGLRRALPERDTVGAPALPVAVFGSRPAWAAAMLILLLVAVGAGIFVKRPGRRMADTGAGTPAIVEWAETEVPGASTMVYRDEETGLTVIWLIEGEETEDAHAGS